MSPTLPEKNTYNRRKNGSSQNVTIGLRAERLRRIREYTRLRGYVKLQDGIRELIDFAFEVMDGKDFEGEIGRYVKDSLERTMGDVLRERSME